MTDEQNNTTPAAEEPQTAEAPQQEPQNESKKDKKHRLELRIEELEAAAKAREEQYKRMLAEYDNFRKRTQKERETLFADAGAATVAAFLPVMDNLERAAAAEEAPEGARLILKQFGEILEKQNVRPFGQEGEAFDPARHNALLHEDGEGGETVVAQVFKKGYAQGDRIIRHADVKTRD